MKDKKENLADRAGNLCALTMALKNLLSVLITGGAVWMIYQTVDNSTLYSLVNGKFLSR